MDVRSKRRVCTKYCDIGYVIKDHVKLLMQLLTNDLPQFNFRLQSTKCLNTAIMLLQFLVGDKSQGIADACDTRAVIKRHTNGEEQNDTIIKELTKQLFSKREKSRTLYYILLSDGYFPQSTATNQPKYFPGHVFILEKIYDDDIKTHVFFFYQSYINQYTLKEHIQMNKGLRITSTQAQQLLSDLASVLQSKTWDRNNVRKWYNITFADSSNLLDTESQNRFYLCFRKAKTTTCLQRLEQYLKTKHSIILSNKTLIDNNIYGDVLLYDDDTKPLTNNEVLMGIETLLQKIKNSKKKL